MMIYVHWRARVVQTRCHHLFVCSHEKSYCTGLMNYLHGKMLVRLVDVPGNRHIVLLHRELAELARHLTKKLLSWMLEVHSLNRSFEGNFTAAHLYVTTCKQIKIQSSQRAYMRALTSEGRSKDRHRIAQILQDMLLSSTNGPPTTIPYDVQHLLELLRNGYDDDDFVLARHPAGMTWTEKLCLFMECFTQMETLEIREPEKYKLIVELLPHNGTWQELVEVNDHLRKVFHWRKREEAYTTEPSSMLQVQRNSLAHLVKMHSMKVTKKKNKKTKKKEVSKVEILFKYKQIAVMFNFTFPMVTAVLQLCLHREGELKNLYEEDGA